jgi:hypothetical protein
MDISQEFHYRLPGRVSGQRPGSHPGSSIGAGQEFVTHMSLYDRPDPRRLDLRASLRGFNDDWLVRVNRQRAGAAVRAIVDVSASMTFGGQRPKLHVVADFVEALGLSAFRVGDAVGMMAFDESERGDLFMPARVSRGMGSVMATALRELCDAGSVADAGGVTGSTSVSGAGGTQAAGSVRGARGVAGARASRAAPGRRVSRAASGDTLLSDGLEDAASRLAGQQGLVFLISDFHWPLERLDIVLDLLAHAGVVPVIVWDPAETEPPSRNALASLCDAESGARRTLWLRPRLRQEWRQAVARRRAEIDSFFAAHSIRPFYVEGAFNADALSRYFFEADL